MTLREKQEAMLLDLLNEKQLHPESVYWQIRLNEKIRELKEAMEQ